MSINSEYTNVKAKNLRGQQAYQIEQNELNPLRARLLEYL